MAMTKWQKKMLGKDPAYLRGVLKSRFSTRREKDWAKKVLLLRKAKLTGRAR